jgi:hypothetical protein
MKGRLSVRKLVEVQEAIVKESEILFTIGAQEPAEAIEAAGQMIADSDGGAFIYLLDTGTDFIYIQFKEHTWQAMGAAMKREGVPLLQWGEQIMPLASFHEEFWMLLENIEDNDNYGVPFRMAVEEAFREILASRA